MKTIIACCTLLILVSSTSFAQEVNADLKMAVKAVESSFNSCDSEAMDTLTRPDFEVVTIVGTIVKPEKGGLCGNGESFDYNFEVINASVVGHTGVAVHRATGSETNGEGETISVNSAVTTVWIQEGEKWVLKHAHIAAIADQ